MLLLAAKPLPLGPVPSNWVEYGLCRNVDTNVFFVHRCTHKCRRAGCKSTGADRCRSICSVCPVVEQCQEWSIRELQHGFSGNMTEYERIKARKQRGINFTRESV